MKSALIIQLGLAAVLILAILCIRRGLLRHTYVWTLSVSAIVITAFVGTQIDTMTPGWVVALTAGYILMNISLMIHLSELSRKGNHVSAPIDPLRDLCRTLSGHSATMVPKTERTTVAQSG